MTIEQVKALDMVDYLSRQGYEPKKISGHHYWYHSPFRNERTPSFKVNRMLNRWFDFAEGKGGNLIDFGIRLHGCSVTEFLQNLSSGAIDLPKHATKKGTAAEDGAITVLAAFSITSYPLINYLHERRISLGVAAHYLQEVHYRIGDKTFYALGFKNDAGGYELRNRNFKGSSSPKETTFIDNGSKELTVFEGFFDFLSYLSILQKKQAHVPNYLILNSTSFFEKSLSKMQEHRQVGLFLDNDKTGSKYTELALSLDKERFTDERSLYQQFGDLNDWLLKVGKTQRRQPRPRL